MSTNFDGKLTYRDYVVHIFTGILFDVFLILALNPPLGEYCYALDTSNEIILSLIAIPILFLEGHFLLAIDRLFFVEIPTWIFRKTKVSFRDAKTKLFERHRFLFILLFGKRILGQKIILEIEQSEKSPLFDPDIANNSHRYYILSDFFKGEGCAAWIALIVSFVQCNCFAIVILLVVVVLSWFRARFYSRMYVKSCLAKNDIEKERHILTLTINRIID